jgi:hypothetical protein
MQTRLSHNARVRCISVSCRQPSDDRRDKKNFYRPTRVYSDNGAWHPLADMMATMPPLSEIKWEDDRLPSCILQSLKSQHHGCRLRIVGVKRGVDKPLDIDEQPAAKLFSMYELLLPLQNDYICRESLNRIEAGDEDVIGDLATVGNLSAGLIHLKQRHTYDKQHCAVRRTDSSGFEFIRRRMIGPQARYASASLASLDFISHFTPEHSAKIRESESSCGASLLISLLCVHSRARECFTVVHSSG